MVLPLSILYISCPYCIPPIYINTSLKPLFIYATIHGTGNLPRDMIWDRKLDGLVLENLPGLGTGNLQRDGLGLENLPREMV